VPPVPPQPELMTPQQRPAGAPMMDYLQRRLESVERELLLERERANSASALLKQQEALKSEVENHLKSMTEQLRREKAEKEGEAEKSHARGRVEALELRLDEMTSTFAQLLKEAVASRQAPAAAAAAGDIGAEMAVFRRTIKDVAALLPEMRGLAARIPESEQRYEELVARRLDDFAARLQANLSDWERRHDVERRKQDDRLQALVDERSAFARMWEEQGQSLRQEFLKERIAREVAVSAQIAELAKRIDTSAKSQDESAAGSSEIREKLDTITRTLAATPKAKDEIILELEQEKADLMRSMRERHEQLRATLEERRKIEMTMGDSLLQLAADLEKERDKTRAAESRAADVKGDIEALAHRYADLERTCSERDARALSLGAERDELTRALVAESEKFQAALADRTASDERWNLRLLELQTKLEAETARAGQEASISGDLRAKIATLSEHMTRALQERDAVVARFAEWERERQRLLGVIKQKDNMVSMLSSAFKGTLKKP
jgi:DNA repair exonuclease SbcCD ATPase subunit